MKKLLIIFIPVLLLITSCTTIPIGNYTNTTIPNSSYSPNITNYTSPGPGFAMPQPYVEIINYDYTPKILTVAVNTEVTWTQRDNVQHDVVSTENTFRSPLLSLNENYSYKFTTPGTYDYYCSIHPNMKGTIIVIESNSTIYY